MKEFKEFVKDWLVFWKMIFTLPGMMIRVMAVPIMTLCYLSVRIMMLPITFCDWIDRKLK